APPPALRDHPSYPPRRSSDLSRQQAAARAEEIARIERDSTSLTAQRAQWQDALQERRLALVELEAAAKEAEAHVGLAEADLAQRSEEHTSELQSRVDIVCRLL